MTDIIRLNGCNIHRITYTDETETEIESVLLKFGMLYMPLQGDATKRLKIHDSGEKLFDECEETIKSYSLDVEGMDFEDEYKALSNLIGADFRDVFFKMSILEEQKYKSKLYREVHDKSRVEEW